MANPWASAGGGIMGPLTKAIAVTPHDTTLLTDTARALYVGGSGNVVLLLLDGTTVTLTSVAAGVWHPIMFNRVNLTSTTATNIVAGY